LAKCGKQVGKTTLAIQVAEKLYPGQHVRLDLENPQDLNRLSEPRLYLERHREKLILIDEVQRKPELFPILRYLADQGGYHFLLLGSSSPK
jgi:predicted AAA+ superfamily ATPase